MEVCTFAESPRGTGDFSVLLLSILTPIFLMLCAFSIFINSRILSLTCSSAFGQVSNDWRLWDEDAQEDQMSYSPATNSRDLLDGGIDDIQFQPLRPLTMKPVQDENLPPVMNGPDDLLGSIADKLHISALDPKVKHDVL